MAPVEKFFAKLKHFDGLSRSEKENYGPIDGVLPKNHGIYHLLNQSTCLSWSSSDSPICVDERTHHVYCFDCSQRRPDRPHVVEVNEYHRLVGDEDSSVNCAKCNNIVLVERKANECHLCIEEFLISRMEFVTYGGISVVKRF